MKREGVIKGSLALSFSFIFLLGILSNVFAGLASEYKMFPVPEECMEQVRKEGSKLYIYDWAGWWPEEIYEGFEKEFGIDIVRDNFADMDEMFTKFKLHPEAKYDLTLPEPRVFMEMKKLGLLQKINWNWLPNVKRYLADRYKKSPIYEPGLPYGVPSEDSFLGYAYNPKFVDENDPRIGSWAFVFEGKEYAGKITMMNDMYNVIGTALQYLGYSYNSDNEEELMEAKALLARLKPWVMAYDSWPKRLVLEEEAWIAQMWVGDALLVKEELPDLKIVIPKEGSVTGADTLVIPKGAPHPATAHLFINYLYRPHVYAKLIETIKYHPTHTKAVELLPEEIRKLPTVAIPKEVLDKCELIQPKAYTGKGKELRMKIWEELKR